MWAALLALCAPRLAHALDQAKTTPLSVTLEYEAPGQCLGAREFRAIVGKRLGRDPFVDASPNRVFVLVSPLAGVLSGELVWRDDTGSTTGQHSFPSTSNHCAQLIEAMAFALAIQIQLLETEAAEKAKSASRAGTSAGTTPPKGVPPPSPAPPPPPAPSPSPSPSGPSGEQPSVGSDRSEPARRPAVVFLGGGGGLAVGMASQVVPEGRLFAGLRWTAVAIELGLEASAPVTTRRADGAGFSQWFLLSSAAGCALFEPWSACALLKVGTVRVTGRDIDEPKAAGTALVQSGLRLAVNPRLSSRVFLSLRAEGLVNLNRWSVTLDQIPVSSAPPFAWVTGLDFGVLLP